MGLLGKLRYLFDSGFVQECNAIPKDISTGSLEEKCALSYAELQRSPMTLVSAMHISVDTMENYILSAQSKQTTLSYQKYLAAIYSHAFAGSDRV